MLTTRGLWTGRRSRRSKLGHGQELKNGHIQNPLFWWPTEASTSLTDMRASYCMLLGQEKGTRWPELGRAAMVEASSSGNFKAWVLRCNQQHHKLYIKALGSSGHDPTVGDHRMADRH